MSFQKQIFTVPRRRLPPLRVGFFDKRIVSDCQTGARLCFSAKAVIHKNKRFAKGHTVNVSKTGVFVATEQRMFRPKELVSLFVKPQNGKKHFKIIAQVIRFNSDRRYPVGYGLRFIKTRISSDVDRQAQIST